jgi:type I restriction enzyme S subunit
MRRDFNRPHEHPAVNLPDHLDLIAAAPAGIQKLRGLILELAVRGRLVPQDPNDEPASELLKRIAKERARLEAEGLYKKYKVTPLVGEDQPFDLPKGWEWERLDRLFEIQDSLREPINRAERDARGGEYPYYGANGQVGTIDGYRFDGERILVAEDGGFFSNPIRGVAYIANGRFWVNNHAHVLRPLCGTASRYWVSFFNRLDWMPLVRGATREKLNQAVMQKIPMAVPPLAEQHRIVAKVDELMALCDRLEAEQADAGAAHATLVATLLGTLTQSADAAELAANWQRLAEHFDTLFTTESSLDALKQTILQLAVMGKLVPQDPSDEPASELLKRIAKERARLESEGTCKKLKATPVVGEAEQPYLLPDLWEWARLGIAMELISGQHLTPDEYTEGLSDPIPYLTGPAEFGETYPNPTRSTKQTRAIAISGDILLTVKGSGVGKLNRVSQSKLAISRQLMAVRTIAVCSNFLELVLRSAEQHFQDQTVGIAIPGIGRNDVQGLVLGLPPPRRTTSHRRQSRRTDGPLRPPQGRPRRVPRATGTPRHHAD